MLGYFCFAFVSAIMLAAAYFDLRYMIIPNWFSIALVIGFIAAFFGSDLIFTETYFDIIFALGVFLVGFILFSVGAMGGGDVKLLAASSLWIGVNGAIYFIFIVSIAGALLGLIKMGHIIFKNMRSENKESKTSFVNVKIPYGIAIALGVIMSFPKSIWMS